MGWGRRMRRRALSAATVGALCVLLLAQPAFAEGAPSAGADVEDGTPVAHVSTPGSSGEGGAGSSAITCTYTLVDTQNTKVYDLDGTEIIQNEPGDWYVRRCFDASGQEVQNYSVWIADVDPAVLAAEAKKELPLPRPAVATSPEAGGDQLVGVPTWLWIEGGWAPASATASLPGVSVTVTAVPESVTWDMGDGSKVVCRGPGTPYDDARKNDEQKTDCSHTYRRSSAGQPGDRYPVAATLSWRVSWSASGVPGGGSLGAVTRTTRFGLRVAEAQALNQ